MMTTRFARRPRESSNRMTYTLVPLGIFLACATAAWGLKPLMLVLGEGDAQFGIAYLVWWTVLPFASAMIVMLVTSGRIRRLAYTGASALGCSAGNIISIDRPVHLLSFGVAFALVASVLLSCCGGTVGLVIRGVWMLVFGTSTKQVASGYCPSCGYNLTGNVSGTCPECGAVVPVNLVQRGDGAGQDSEAGPRNERAEVES